MSNSQYVRYVALTLTLLSLAIQTVSPTYSSTHPSTSSIPTYPDLEQPVHPFLREVDTARVHSVLQNTPVSFVENRGQIDSRIAYYVQGSDTSVYFAPGGLTFRLTAREGNQFSTASGLSTARHGFDLAADLEKCVKRSLNKRRWTAKLDFVGANAHVKPIGQDPTTNLTSFFRGPKEEWKTGLASYKKLVYPDLWPGIDLVYKGSVNQLKYEFVVRPGADPNQIKLCYRGARVRLKRDGSLEVKTPVDSFKDDKPYSYQTIDENRIEVATRYLLQAPNRTGTQRFGFRVGDYDRTRTLLIDPAMVVYAGYIGGALNDLATDIAVDSAGNAYVTGMAYSSESEGFPVRVGPDVNYNPHRASDGTIIGPEFDVFVAKVNADGTGLSYCGYIGGRESQAGLGIAVDSAGNAYVTGFTNSSQATFPVTVGPSLTYGGSTSFIGDAFVAKVNASGTALDYCGYIGGRIYDVGFDIAVDSAGNAYVTGQTGSLGPSQDRSGFFPATVGPTLNHKFGYHNGFVAKVKADGTGLAYCGYIGGNSDDGGLGIAVDAAGSAYVTGYTDSRPEVPGSQPDFPAIVGPNVKRTLCTSVDTCKNYDAFVAKVKPDGTGFVYCGFIGGTQNDIGTRIAVDSAGNAYITGSTGSPQTSFPVTVGPGLTYNGDNGKGTMFGDAFVAKVKADGTGLVYCGYIGGSGGDVGYDIKVDSTGAAYIAGNTTSSPATFPVTDGSTYSGGTLYGDAFVAKVKPDGTGLLFAGYFGGASDDAATGIALDSAGNVYICGGTFSPEASFPVAVGPSLKKNPQQDAFVAKIILDNSPPPARPPIVTGATRQGKMLVVVGKNFDFGALIYINGEKQKKSANDDQNPTTIMIGRKAGKFILPGDKVKVRNSDGTESNEVTFSG